MCIEYIRFAVPLNQHSEFTRAIADATGTMTSYPDCMDSEITQSMEERNNFIWRILWSTAEAHLEGFKKSEIFPAFYKIMEPFIPFIREMNHYQLITASKQDLFL